MRLRGIAPPRRPVGWGLAEALGRSPGPHSAVFPALIVVPALVVHPLAHRVHGECVPVTLRRVVAVQPEVLHTLCASTHGVALVGMLRVHLLLLALPQLVPELVLKLLEHLGDAGGLGLVRVGLGRLVTMVGSCWLSTLPCHLGGEMHFGELRLGLA